MKQFYFLAMSLLMAIGLQAQTGNGILAQIDSPYNFDPTTVMF